MERSAPLRRNTKLRLVGVSDTAQIKQEIQDTLRAIVIARDGGCVLRYPNLAPFSYPYCGGYANDGHLVLQADHLITRGNSGTYADSRLVVCVCKSHHGWKSVGSNLRKKQYDAIMRHILPPERVALWAKMEAEQHQGFRPGQQKVNWVLELAALKQELAQMV